VLPLPIPRHFKQNHRMEKQPDPKAPSPSWVQWAMTPPQSYAVYLVCLFLVAGLSFYVGSLRPKKSVGFGPPPASAPVSAPSAPRN
jgi:hypothetical protein